MHVKRGLITAAGQDDRQLPLQRFVDRDGTTKTAIQIVVEEPAAEAEACIASVVQPNREHMLP